MAETLLGNSLGEALTHLIQQLSKDPSNAGKTPDEIRSMALQRAKERLEARQQDVKDRANARIKKRAKEWADKSKSNEPKERQKALEEMHKGEYIDGITPAQAQERLKQVETVRASAPTWLKANDLRLSPEAIELVSRIAELDPVLQNDPDVLHAELGQFYASVKWGEMSRDARREARQTMNRVLRKIQELTQNNPEYSRSALLDSLDPTLDYVHLDILPEDVLSAGETPKAPGGKPDKDSDIYKNWAKKKIAEAQSVHLQEVLISFQELLDLPNNQDPLNKQKLLRKLIDQLSTGIYRAQAIEGVGKDIAQLNREITLSHIDTIQARLNKLNEVLDLARQEQYGATVTYDMIKDREWFVNLDPEFKNLLVNQDKRVMMKFSYNHWSRREAQKLIELGPEEWAFDFFDRVFGLGTERVSPTLIQQYIQEDFRKFINELYGSNGEFMYKKYGYIWEQRGRMDYIAHEMGFGLDAKEVLRAMGMFKAADEDALLSVTPYVGLARKFMDQATFDVLDDRAVEYTREVGWLKTNIENKFYTPNNEEALKKIQQAYPKAKKDEIDELLHLYGKKELHRDSYLKILQAEKIRSPNDFAVGENEMLLVQIESLCDKWGRGLLLEDTDVWGYADIEIRLADVIQGLELLEKGHTQGTLSTQERDTYEVKKKTLQDQRSLLLEKKRGKLQEIDKNFGLGDDQNVELMSKLSDLRGLSKIEELVFRRMKEYLELTGEGEISPARIRASIWAARDIMVNTGRFAEVGALKARMPGLDYKTRSWKHAMRSPAFEDLVRIMNSEMFADRFTMGGEMGKVVRAYLRFNIRKNRMSGEASFFESHEWKELHEQIFDEPTQAAMKIMEFAERDLGIKFTELLTQGYLAAGAQESGSIWRLDLGVLDEIKKYYLRKYAGKELPKGEVLDNQALAIRYLIAKDSSERKFYAEKMLKRTPTKLFSLVAHERDVLMKKAGLSTDNLTWERFESALKYAETKINDHKFGFETREIDFGTDDDFNEILRPIMEKMENLPKENIDKYQKLLKLLQQHVTEVRDVEGIRESILDAIAREKLPLTLSLDDFDWNDAQMKELGFLAYTRRTRDLGAMGRVMGEVLSFMTNKENILSPNDFKNTLKHLVELRDAIDEYAGRPTAEPFIKDIARLLIEFNRDRSMWSLPSWLPGGKSIGLWLAEMDARGKTDFRGKIGDGLIRGVGKVAEFTLGNLAKASVKIKPLGKFMNWVMPGWKNFAHEPFEHWPHSVAEAISWSVRFTGHHGNRWNEAKIDEFITTMQDMGLFTQNPEFAHDLRGEFKAGWVMKSLAQVRRYWWVIPVASVLMASAQSIEEESKKR